MYDPDEIAVDEFTWNDIERMTLDSVVDAVCSACGAEYRVEPDARNYTCHHGCGSEGTVTSPLVKLGFL